MCACDDGCRDYTEGYDKGYTEGLRTNADMLLNVVNERDAAEAKVRQLTEEIKQLKEGQS